MARRPSFFHHLHPPHIPAREARFRYTFGLGGLAVLLLVSLIVTGILELFYYIPGLEEANLSVHLINQRVPFGALVRSLHYWAAQGLVVVSLLHLARVVFTGAYKPPRRFNWLMGLGLLVLVLLLNFTGYALRWDQDIAWAIQVGTNLLLEVPLVGQELHMLVVGGPAIGEGTVVRFYAWHIYGLALAAVFLAGWHLFRVRRDGGISHARPNPTQGREALRQQKISRNELVRREALAALIACMILLLLAALFPPALGPAADFTSITTEPSAPWFFVWVQQLLRYGPPLWMGVAIPAELLLLLILLPYALDREPTGVGRWFQPAGRRAQLLLLAIFLFVSTLTLWGLAS